MKIDKETTLLRKSNWLIEIKNIFAVKKSKSKKEKKCNTQSKKNYSISYVQIGTNHININKLNNENWWGNDIF